MNTNELARAASRAIADLERLVLTLPREAKGAKIRITNEGTDPCPLGRVHRTSAAPPFTVAEIDPLEILGWLVQRGNIRMELADQGPAPGKVALAGSEIDAAPPAAPSPGPGDRCAAKGCTGTRGDHPFRHPFRRSS